MSIAPISTVRIYQGAEAVFVIEKFIQKIANTQVFGPEDQLGQMVKAYDQDELSEDTLDLVYAARKDDISYASFIRLARERDNKRK